MPPDRMPSMLPCFDSLDDEEALAGLDQPKSSRLPHERGIAGGIGELVLEVPPLAAKALDLRGALRERAPCVDIGVQRPVVEEADQAERPDPEPASDENAAARSALAFLCRSGHGPSMFAQGSRGPAWVEG